MRNKVSEKKFHWKSIIIGYLVFLIVNLIVFIGAKLIYKLPTQEGIFVGNLADWIWVILISFSVSTVAAVILAALLSKTKKFLSSLITFILILVTISGILVYYAWTSKAEREENFVRQYIGRLQKEAKIPEKEEVEIEKGEIVQLFYTLSSDVAFSLNIIPFQENEEGKEIYFQEGYLITSSLSSDSKKAYFLIERPADRGWNLGSELIEYNLETKKKKTLLSARQDYGFYYFSLSPDDKKIVLLEIVGPQIKKKEKYQLILFNLEEEEEEKKQEVLIKDDCLSPFAWSENSRKIYLYSFSAESNYGPTSLEIFDLKEKKKQTLDMAQKDYFSLPTFSSDNTKLVYSYNKEQTEEELPASIRNTIEIYDLKKEERKEIIHKRDTNFDHISWLDEDNLIVSRLHPVYEETATQDIIKIDIKTRKIETIYDEEDISARLLSLLVNPEHGLAFVSKYFEAEGGVQERPRFMQKLYKCDLETKNCPSILENEDDIGILNWF